MLSQAAPSNSAGVGQFDRIGVTAVDGDTSAITTFPCPIGTVATIAAICDTASATITVRMIYYNGSYLPCGSSVPITFTAGKTADFGQLFLGVPDSDMWRPVAGAGSIGIKVDAVSAGRWSLHGSLG